MKNYKGFTLIEVLVAITFFSIAMLGFQKSFMGLMKYNLTAETETEAAAAAQTVLDDLRTADISLLPTSGATSPKIVKIGNDNYEVTTTFCLVQEFCVGGNQRHIFVQVKYKGKEVYKVATVYTKLNL